MAGRMEKIRSYYGIVEYSRILKTANAWALKHNLGHCPIKDFTKFKPILYATICFR